MAKASSTKRTAIPLYQLVFHKYYMDEALNAVLLVPLQWIAARPRASWKATRLMVAVAVSRGCSKDKWRAAATANGLRAKLRAGNSDRCHTDYRLLCSERIERCFRFSQRSVFLPLSGGIALLFIPKQYVSATRWTAFAFAALNFVLALILILLYAEGNITLASTIIGTAPMARFSLTRK